jgi:hypothetical protein
MHVNILIYIILSALLFFRGMECEFYGTKKGGRGEGKTKAKRVL